MTRPTIRLCLSAAMLMGLATGASAQGNSGSGSGLSPYASESGNDRSAGVNNGNYRPPGYGRGGYERRVQERRVQERRVYERPVYERRRGDRYYGYPY